MSKKIIQKKGVTHFSSLQLFGVREKIGAETVTIVLRDEEGNILLAYGTTVPTDATAGYAKGCLFIKTDVATGVKGLYENFGTTSSCNFSRKGFGYKSVAITVTAGATSGSSAADADLVGGEILGIYPTGNQDQLVDNVVLNANGSITVTLAAAATANNTFRVVVLRA